MEIRSIDSTCSHSGCDKPGNIKGMCPPHRAQFLKTGQTKDIKPREKFDSLEDAFLLRIYFDDECWIWTGPTDRFGHGALEFFPYKGKAHRYSYERFVGSIPEGLEIDHQCRTAGCVRPSHLKAVTHAENLQNRGRSKNNTSGFRGVSRFGETHWRAYATLNGRQISGGIFKTVEEANRAAVSLRNRLYQNNMLDRKAADD